MSTKLLSRLKNLIRAPKLCASRISAELESDVEVIFFNEIDSTSLHARRLVGEGKRAPFLVVANSQSAGRGRLGRSFYSPGDSGLYMTLAIDATDSDVGVTTRVGVALCRAIETVYGIADTKIKWVNDVYLGERKVAGILAESVEAQSAKKVFLIGVGVNVSTKDFPPELREIAASLGADAEKRASLCAVLTNEIFFALSEDAESCMDEYRKRSMVIGREVTYFVGGEERVGVAKEILASGALSVITPSGEREILNSGEISLRLKK